MRAHAPLACLHELNAKKKNILVIFWQCCWFDVLKARQLRVFKNKKFYQGSAKGKNEFTNSSLF
jgi:hypothetical protein